MRLFLGMLALLSLQTAWAGSAGGRGGGTGVLCAGDVHPVTVEEFALHRAGREIAIPSRREEIPAWLSEQLDFPYTFEEYFMLVGVLVQSKEAAVPSRFSGLVLDVWKRIGSYDDWEGVPENGITAALASKASVTIDALRSLLGEHGVIPRRSETPPVVGDDLFPVPNGCRKVQLSLLIEQKALKVDPYRISERTKRVLELHETLYALGMLFNHESFPEETQGFVRSLVSDSRAKRREAFRSWINRRGRGYSRFDLGGLYRSNGAKDSCPVLIWATRVGDSLNISSIETTGDADERGRRFVRHDHRTGANYRLGSRLTASSASVIASFAPEGAPGSEHVDFYRVQGKALEMVRYRDSQVRKRGSSRLRIADVSNPRARCDYTQLVWPAGDLDHKVLSSFFTNASLH